MPVATQQRHDVIPSRRPLAVVAALLVPVLAALVGVLGAAPARSLEWIVLCTGYDACAAAGYPHAGYKTAGSNSYWSQSRGHNCTNYVAYRLVQNGMPNQRPTGLSGNAVNWGPFFRSQMNDQPAVGSIAYWDTSFSSTGHVAYVERVVSASEVVISEDNWGGDFRWRRVTRAGGRWPQGFIHLRDVTAPQPPTPAYQALTPTRLLDTRTGIGAPVARIRERGELSLQMAGRGGLPATGVGSVVINVTTASPLGAGYVTVYPSGASRPGASQVNYRAGATVANQVVVRVGADGRIRFFASASTHLIADVAGWYSTAGHLRAMTPARLADTRTGTGTPRARVPAGGQIDVAVLGRGGVPSTGVGSVALNLTAVRPSGGGWLTLWPSGGAVPGTSSVNYRTGVDVPGLVITKVGSGGKVSVRSSAETDVLVDVSGWLPTGSDLVGLTPSRVLDTRSGLGGSTGATTPRTSIGLAVTGRGGVPATGVKAVLLTVISIDSAASGWATVYPSGAARPLASNLNHVARQTVANSVLAKVGSDGAVRLYTSASTHLVVDVQGYVRQ